MTTGEATGKRCFADSMAIMPSHPGLFLSKIVVWRLSC